MTTMSTLLRLVPVALAGLASIATSAPPMDYLVQRVTPPDRESGLPADFQPSVVLYSDKELEQPDGRHLSLSTEAGQPVAGTVVTTTDGFGEITVTFAPAAPLAPGDYVLRFAKRDLPFASDHYYDAATRTDHYLGDGPLELRFSTLSRPEVRYFGRAPSAGPDDVYELSFTQEMDPATLEAIKALDATGDELPIARRWIGGETHVLEIEAPRGVVSLMFEEGLRAADGTAPAGLPMAFDTPR